MEKNDILQQQDLEKVTGGVQGSALSPEELKKADEKARGSVLPPLDQVEGGVGGIKKTGSCW